MMKLNFTLFTLFLTFLIRAQVPTNGVQVIYTFNGNADDMSGNGFHGIVNGPTSIKDRNLAENSAYEFDGIDDHIVIPDDPALKPNFPLTISLWLKIDDFPAGSSLVYASEETTGKYSGFWIGYTPTGQIAAAYGNGLGVGAQYRVSKHSGSVIDTVKWHHVVAVFNGPRDIDLYIDCVEYPGNYSGTASNSNIVYTGSTGAIGRGLGHHGDSYHDGKVDDIRVFNRALNSTELDQLCQETDPLLSSENQIEQESVSIYPNPTFGQINIDFEKSSDAAFVEVYSMNGQKVMVEELTAERTFIDMSNHSKGLYLLRLVDRNGILVYQEEVVVQ